ncbi:MAG: hypothetical protein GPJ54_18510 [Candidatus Heimdallarchaeota archaeon]|nr:hypothetical protein [Candidatus Heimdallarchaeota archaeon]
MSTKKGLAKSLKDRTYSWTMFHYRIAHHPTCSNFDEHFYQIKNNKVCRGCAMMYSGYIVGIFSILILFYLEKLRINELHLALYFLYLPTVATSYMVKNRQVKDVARFLLGNGIIVAIVLIVWGIFSRTYWISLFVSLQYLLFRALLSKKREKSNNDVCTSCDEFTNPRCSGLRDYHDRFAIYQSGLIRLDAFSE